jgi:methylmalonyl-CoA/ethylmalonyl-CoA epimerase
MTKPESSPVGGSLVGHDSGRHASSGSSLRRVDHVGIVVHDIEASAPVWVDRLGLQRLETVDVLDGSIRMTYLQAGDTTLQLVEPRTPGPLREYLEQHGEGLHHLCFMVDDIPSALEALGETPLAPPYSGGRGASVCFMTSTPNQVRVELTEPGPQPGRGAVEPVLGLTDGRAPGPSDQAAEG